MRGMLPMLVIALSLVAGPAAAQLDADLTITNVNVESAGGGLANITATVAFVGWGALPALSSGVGLEIDGTVIAVDPVVTLPYVATGCTYYANWNNLGPACIDEPGCDVFIVNGGSVPGDCFLGTAYSHPYVCGCWHHWQVLFPNVSLAGAALLRVIADVQNTVWELREDNNIFTIESPVEFSRDSWGTTKAVYR